MKKGIVGSLCLIIGFLLFCLLHMAQLKSRKPFYDYAYMIGSILVVSGLLLGLLTLRKQNIMPIIAAGFSFAPFLLLLLWHIPYIGRVFAMVFFASYWGLGFCLVGFILSSVSLFKEIKTGIIYSIIAMFAPFVWALYLGLYARNGGELFL